MNEYLMRNLVVVALLLLIAGCASTPVDEGYLDRAMSAIQAAEQAGAPELAPLDFRFAREKLTEAQAAHAARDYALAQRLAEQCAINARLSVARSEAAQARKQTRALRERNKQLKADLGTDAGAGR